MRPPFPSPTIIHAGYVRIRSLTSGNVTSHVLDLCLLQVVLVQYRLWVGVVFSKPNSALGVFGSGEKTLLGDLQSGEKYQRGDSIERVKRFDDLVQHPGLT